MSARFNLARFLAGVVVTAALLYAAYSIWTGLERFTEGTIVGNFPVVAEVVAIFLLLTLADWIFGRGGRGESG